VNKAGREARFLLPLNSSINKAGIRNVEQIKTEQALINAIILIMKFPYWNLSESEK